MPKGQKNRVHPDIDINEVKLLAGQGLTVKQIGHCVGYGKSALYNKQEVMEAIKAGRSEGIKQVTNALFENATQSSKQNPHGNAVAQIFYLKNRAPHQWMDRKAIEVDGEIRLRTMLVELISNDIEGECEPIPDMPKLNGQTER